MNGKVSVNDKVSKTVTIGAVVPSDLADAMNQLAERNERTFSAELRIALKAHIKSNEPAPERVA